MMEYLEFERPLADIESQIETLRKNTDIQEVAILQAIEKLKQKISDDEWGSGFIAVDDDEG